MANTHFTGPVYSTNGFVGAVTGTITGNITGNVTGNVTGDVTGNLTGNVTGSVSAGITSGATAAEINARADDSAMVDTRADAGAISVAVAYTAITTTGAAAVTLAVPTKPAFIKVIKMTTDGGDATLAFTNIVDSAGSAQAVFGDVGDTLILCSDTVSGKWVLLANIGCTLS